MLLRGINLGRARRVAMADLRVLLSDLGYSDVRTVLQSGNAVFGVESRSAEPGGAESRRPEKPSAEKPPAEKPPAETLSAETLSPERLSPERLCAQITERIAGELDLKVDCVIRSAAELAAVVAANPFPDKVSEGAKLMVTFLSGPLDPARFAGHDPADFAPDEFRLADREIYSWLPNGMAASRIPVNFWDRRTGMVATTRNWNTVTRLLALVDA